MNRHFSLNWTLLLAALMLAPGFLMAQTNQNDAARWLAAAELTPAFTVPSSLSGWKAKRKQVRAELWQLLGQLPPRPKVPDVEMLAREDRGDYVAEKF